MTASAISFLLILLLCGLGMFLVPVIVYVIAKVAAYGAYRGREEFLKQHKDQSNGHTKEEAKESLRP